MARTRRSAVTALVLAGTTLGLAGCGGGEEPAAAAETLPAATSAAQPAVASPEPAPETTVSPRVAAASVAPLVALDDSPARLFGQDGVDSGYQLLVDLTTVRSFDSDFFFSDGDNSAADLEPLMGLFHPEQADYLRTSAEACLGEDDRSCGNLYGITYFNFGKVSAGDSDGDHLTYRPDGEFVVDQAVTEPTVTTGVVMGVDTMAFTLSHVAHVRAVYDGRPTTVTMTRTLSYDLAPADPGSAAPWVIADWDMTYRGDVVDEATGQPLTD